MNPESQNRLRDEGWKRRFVTDLVRVEEWIELYTRMGFEVKVVPHEPVQSGACDICIARESENMRVIYTRKFKTSSERETEGED